MLNQYPVDFLVIGAQKAGTTSLFKYLSDHPQIYMPSEKEVEFFHDDQKFSRGKEWYYNAYFANADPRSVKGEASTHYMMYGCAPERIHQLYPDIKLISLLRNPIDRAYSHYRMAVRRGLEKRTFEQAISEAIQAKTVLDSEIDHDKEYLFFGEYGRILRNYLQWFDQAQIMVLFTEQLHSEPSSVVQQAYGFLGVNPKFIPQNITKKYHASGVQRFPGLTQALRRYVSRLKKKKWVNRYLWRINFEAVFFWVETQFNIKPVEDSGPNTETRKKLAQFYARDVALLKELTHVDPPWPEFH